MRKLTVLLIACVLLFGCATTTFTKGDMTIKMQRTPFMASAVSWSGDSGAIGMDTSAQLNQLLANLTELTATLSKMYGQSQGIPGK